MVTKYTIITPHTAAKPVSISAAADTFFGICIFLRNLIYTANNAMPITEMIIPAIKPFGIR